MQNNPEERDFGNSVTDRPEDFLKPKAWLHSEIAGGFESALWKEKVIDDFATYPKRNQGKQNSCVAYWLAKQLAVDELQENGVWRELSPRSVYSYMAIKGAGGSSSIESAKFACKFGLTLEHLLPSDGLEEKEMQSDKGYATDAKQIALVYKPGSYIECNTDFDTLASVIATHRAQGIKKTIGISMIGKNNGTMSSMFPQPPTGKQDNTTWYHRVTVTDFGLMNGKKYISIDNSMGEAWGIKGQQFLGEEYAPFIYGGIYTLNQPDNWQQLAPASVVMPKYKWEYDMTVGSSGKDVEMLQTALQSLGMFPISKIIKPTGVFGGLTRNSVITFQNAFAIPQTGNVGPITRAKLNEIFAG